MQAIAFAIFDFFAKNKIARWALMIVTGYVIFRVLLGRHDKKIRKEEQVAYRREQQIVREEIQQTNRTIDDDLQERSERAAEAVAAAPEFSSLDELRELRPDLAERILRNRR